MEFLHPRDFMEHTCETVPCSSKGWSGHARRAGTYRYTRMRKWVEFQMKFNIASVGVRGEPERAVEYHMEVGTH